MLHKFSIISQFGQTFFAILPFSMIHLKTITAVKSFSTFDILSHYTDTDRISLVFLLHWNFSSFSDQNKCHTLLISGHSLLEKACPETKKHNMTFLLHKQSELPAPETERSQANYILEVKNNKNQTDAFSPWHAFDCHAELLNNTYQCYAMQWPNHQWRHIASSSFCLPLAL